MKIAFIHPDLGIGGAERLVVDAAVGLQNRGHQVVIYTSYCNRSHCFEEVRDGMLKVVVLGDKLIPPKLFNRFAILGANLRQLHLAQELITSGLINEYDVFIVDQLSTIVPILQANSKGRVLFYGHFPDQLLAERKSLTKKLYRMPFDWVEKWTTEKADVMVVNSKFTRGVFNSLWHMAREPEVIYPCVDTEVSPEFELSVEHIVAGKKMVISVNRFERKKNIGLAIEAFSKITAKYPETMLIVAGGYDPRVKENVEYHHELQKLCDKLNLSHQTITTEDKMYSIDHFEQVLFLPSVTTPVKNSLVKHSRLLLYTPENEHFGIVPLEAMLLKTPVLACNSGGPLETVVDGETGWALPPDAEQWGKKLEVALDDSNQAEMEKIGEAGYARVLSEFSKAKMAEQFEQKANKALEAPPQPAISIVPIIVIFLLFFFICFFGLYKLFT
ncbi:alpha-1,3/1,6-mannosyltransferase Alg2p [Trichomonascus vanleenenianus]|uniref:GDP-Man:Man(1)GlcNAc(2)-PP-dolichol alpha-1,3-mannosyltransferase n=1 Tax=Trichomonascus vanleenenianus TaxID=2268995 RepID=UPI003ECAEB28